MNLSIQALRGTAVALLLAISASPPAGAQSAVRTSRSWSIDVGYDWAPRAYVQADDDGSLEYCRFIGDPAKAFIACSTIVGYSGRDFTSAEGIDAGYDWGPRAFVDVNGDRRADYCRLVGDPHTPKMACMLMEPLEGGGARFSRDQYGYQSAEAFKGGQTWVGSGFGDVDGDKQADFCYFEESGSSKILCLMAGAKGFAPAQRRFSTTLQQASIRGDLPAAYVDVTNDGKAEFCHFFDSAGETILRCLSEPFRHAAEDPGLSFAAGVELPADDTGARINDLSGVDVGYPGEPRGFADANGDGRADYCRFVGDPAKAFIACLIDLRSTEKQYDFGSGPLDPGRPNLPRAFVDVDNDGKADFCRFMDGPPNAWIRCAIAYVAKHYIGRNDFIDTDFVTE